MAMGVRASRSHRVPGRGADAAKHGLIELTENTRTHPRNGKSELRPAEILGTYRMAIGEMPSHKVFFRGLRPRM